MYGLPLYFRVSSMHADEYGYRADLKECRRPLAAVKDGPIARTPAPQQPAVTLSIEMSPETFATLRIGQEFDLSDRPLMGQGQAWMGQGQAFKDIANGGLAGAQQLGGQFLGNR